MDDKELENDKKKLSYAIEICLSYSLTCTEFTDIFFRYLNVRIARDELNEDITDQYGPYACIGWQVFELVYAFSCLTEKNYNEIVKLYSQAEIARTVNEVW